MSSRQKIYIFGNTRKNKMSTTQSWKNDEILCRTGRGMYFTNTGTISFIVYGGCFDRKKLVQNSHHPRSRGSRTSPIYIVIP